MSCVYAIGSTENLKSKNYDMCYIGVTANVFRRWVTHKSSMFTVGVAIRANAWNIDENMVIIFEGESEICFDMESKFRPYPKMGLNEAVGGCGGYTSYDEQRNKKISSKLKGRVTSDEHRRKISEGKKLQKNSQGARNCKAKIWKLIDPIGDEHIIHGELIAWCDQKGITWSTLKRNLGCVIGQVSPKFRTNGDLNALEKRIATIGWLMMEV